MIEQIEHLKSWYRIKNFLECSLISRAGIDHIVPMSAMDVFRKHN